MQACTKMKPKIYLGTDHAGFRLKESVKAFLKKAGYPTEDVGAYSYDSEDDYPDFIHKAAKKVSKDKRSFGIVFGGSGQGEAITANKVKGVRAALYYGKNIDIIGLSRAHNDANVLSLGARFLTEKEGVKVVKIWLNTPFSNKGRHLRRIKKISKLEK
jgi:ribose 5-phosphate isomerase B